MSKHHAAEQPETKQFLGLWEIIAFALGFCAVIALFFPEREIVRTVLNNPGEASPVYIKALIRADPASDGLKIALSENYLKSGKYVKAESVLKDMRVTVESQYFPKYAVLKFEILKAEFYYSGTGASEKEKTKKEIGALLHSLLPIEAAKFKRPVPGNAPMPPSWLLEGYRFEYSMKNYELALSLLNKYLVTYPRERGKYSEDLIGLYADTGRYRKAYEMLQAYIKSRGGAGSEAVFESAAAKAVLSKNTAFTKMLIGIYKKEFPKNIDIEKYILTLALQTGDPVFARSVALELSGENG